MISQSAEYALRAVIFLAQHPEQPATTHRIAEGTGMPVGYLAKVMQGLVRRAIVRSKRGRRGGFVLNRPVTDMTLLEIVNAVDPIRRYAECPLRLPWHCKELCPLHRRLDEAAAAVERRFGRTTIAQLLPQATKGAVRRRADGRRPTARRRRK